MINSPAFKEEARYTLSVEVMSGSYLDGKIVDELRPAGNVALLLMFIVTGKTGLPKAETECRGIKVQIEMDSQDIENSMSR